MFQVPSKRASGSPCYTCSGEVALITPGDVVHIPDERESRVLQVNAHSSTVVLKRVDQASNESYPSFCNQRSFMRPSTDIGVSRYKSLHCMCEPPRPQYYQTSMTLQLSAPFRIPAQSPLKATLKHTNAEYLNAQGSTLYVVCYKVFKKRKHWPKPLSLSSAPKSTKLINRKKIANLQQRIAALRTENEALLKWTLELTEDVSSLKSITTNSRQVPVMQRMVLFNILKLLLLQMPSDKYPEDVPPEYFFNLLNCSPSSTPEVIQENIRCRLQLLHSDKTPSVPPYPSQFVPIVSFLKTILPEPAPLPV